MNKIAVLGFLTVLPLVLTACIVRDSGWSKPAAGQNLNTRPTPVPYHTRAANLHGVSSDLKNSTPSLFNISWSGKRQTN